MPAPPPPLVSRPDRQDELAHFQVATARAKHAKIMAIVGPIVLVPLLLFAITEWTLLYLQTSEPYVHAMAVLRANPKAKQALGQPISAGWFVNGMLWGTSTKGGATLQIPVHGNLRKGTLRVSADGSESGWKYEVVALEVEGEGQMINLLHPSEAGREK